VKGQQGFSIVVATFVLVVLGLLGTYMVRLSANQISTSINALQGARAYQAAHAGIEWSIARIANGGACSNLNAQTAMSFAGLDGFLVRISCSSQTYSEADKTINIFRINALSQFGSYTDNDYVARDIEVSIVN
jgi:MSHA biogenesis protein MshP